LTGVEVRGVDFDPSCRETAARVHGVEVDTGDLRSQKYPDDSFDVVTSHHCLEHVYDPQTELREMQRIARPGGWVHIEVPTAGALSRLFGGRWAFLQPPTHFYHFRPEAIRALVERAGLTDIRVMRPWLPGELAFSLVHAAGVKGAIPAIVLPAKSLRDKLVKAFFLAALVIDVPITAILAALGIGGLIRVLARKPTV
jgi:SAM-dependent methyltransferase